MKFRKTYIEITNVCNLSCEFCPKTSRQPSFMDIDLFRRILSQLRGISKGLYFHVLGEPLLHPSVGEFLDECSSSGFSVAIITNGTLLADNGSTLINKPALRQVSVSLQSLSKQMKEQGLRDYLLAVKAFADESAKNSKAIIQLRLWNKGAIDPDFRIFLLNLIQIVFEVPFSIDDRLKSLRAFPLAGNLCIDSALPFTWPNQSHLEIGAKGTCYGLRNQCAILVDGTVTACCLDSHGSIDLGNINERPFSEIVSGPRAIAVRKGFEKGELVEELCRKCSYRVRFSPQAIVQTLP
jgi:radical SAM protein with 4Fe4S-binding SPASM domain